MPIDSLAAAGDDPLTALAEAMDAAVEAAKDGAERARATIGDFVPAAGRFLARVVYRASYAVSFGVVYPAVLLANAVPRTNAVVHGLIDGAQAAMGAVQDKKATAHLEAAPQAR
jgi:hypothetical protein